MGEVEAQEGREELREEDCRDHPGDDGRFRFGDVGLRCVRGLDHGQIGLDLGDTLLQFFLSFQHGRFIIGRKFAIRKSALLAFVWPGSLSMLMRSAPARVDVFQS